MKITSDVRGHNIVADRWTEVSNPPHRQAQLSWKKYEDGGSITKALSDLKKMKKKRKTFVSNNDKFISKMFYNRLTKAEECTIYILSSGYEKIFQFYAALISGSWSTNGSSSF